MTEGLSRRTFVGLAAGSCLLGQPFARAQTPAASSLRLAVFDAPNVAETVQIAIDLFTAQHPDLSVSVETILGDYVAQIAASRQAGSGYDLILLRNNHLSAAASNNILQPISSGSIDVTPYPTPLVDALQQSDQLLALPWSWAQTVMLYDKVVLEAVGRNPTDPPWSWNSMRGLLIALKDSIGQPPMSLDANFEHFFLFWTQSNDQPMGSGNLIQDMENESTNRALGYLNGLYRNWLAMTSDRFLAASAEDAFIQGMTSVAYAKPQLVQRVLRETPDRSVVTGIVPQGKANRMTTATWTAIGIGQGTANLDAAMKLASHLAGPTTGGLIWEGLGELPAHQESAQTIYDQHPALAACAGSASSTFVEPRWAEYPAFGADANGVIQQVVTGQIDVIEAQNQLIEAAKHQL